MLFVLSKLLVPFTQPLTWLALWFLLVLAVLRRRPGAARAGLAIGLALLVLLGFRAPPDALLRSLERRYPVPQADEIPRHAGVIVLGGAIELHGDDDPRAQVPLNEAAERMTVPLEWLRRDASLQLLFSGGNGSLFPSGTTEAELARRFYTEQGVDPERLRFESRSRTTRENAREVVALLGADCSRWLLLTSAFHMPRAMAEFDAAGCHPTPWPVDFRSDAETPWTSWSLARNLVHWEVALHEWLGILAYRITRKT